MLMFIHIFVFAEFFLLFSSTVDAAATESATFANFSLMDAVEEEIALRPLVAEGVLDCTSVWDFTLADGDNIP